MLNSIELLVREDNLLSNHGNQHMDITHQPWNHEYFVVACLQRYPLTIIIKMTHNQISIGLLYSTFPLLFCCHVSPNPMAVPK